MSLPPSGGDGRFTSKLIVTQDHCRWRHVRGAEAKWEKEAVHGVGKDHASFSGQEAFMGEAT